jgi:hypothetical protein
VASAARVDPQPKPEEKMSTYGARHGLPGYDQFRTGLDFATAQKMLWVESDDPADWKRKSRGCVLGLMHSLKMTMYREMLDRTGGLAPVRKRIRHTGRVFFVTYWVRAERAAPDCPREGRVPVKKQIVNGGRTMTVTYWIKPERIAA